MAWLAATVAREQLAGAVTLEVGSYDVNGSARPFFHGRYIGLDMRNGPGVDVLGVADALPFKAGTFEVVVCTEVLEHDRRPWRTMVQAARVLRSGGLFLCSARGYDERGCFPIHEYPGDLWRFSLEGARVLAGDAGLSVVELIADPQVCGFFLLARKTPTATTQAETSKVQLTDDQAAPPSGGERPPATAMTSEAAPELVATAMFSV
jgi:SAM-dependent methyltransferase